MGRVITVPRGRVELPHQPSEGRVCSVRRDVVGRDGFEPSTQRFISRPLSLGVPPRSRWAQSRTGFSRFSVGRLDPPKLLSVYGNRGGWLARPTSTGVVTPVASRSRLLSSYAVRESNPRWSLCKSDAFPSWLTARSLDLGVVLRVVPGGRGPEPKHHRRWLAQRYVEATAAQTPVVRRVWVLPARSDDRIGNLSVALAALAHRAPPGTRTRIARLSGTHSNRLK